MIAVLPFPLISFILMLIVYISGCEGIYVQLPPNLNRREPAQRAPLKDQEAESGHGSC